jgi:N-acyl-D-aspartate/D-glutamate deacylase
MAMVPGGKSLPGDRMYEIQPQIGRPITWTAMMAVPDNSHRDWIDLHRSQSERGPGRNVHPQVSGRPQVAMTTLKSAFALRTPSMLELERQPQAARLAAYRNPEWRRLTAQQLTTLQTRVTWDRWTISDSASHPKLVGMTVANAAASQGKDPLDLAFDLALADGLETRFTVVQFNYDRDEVRELLNLDGAILGLADSGAHPDQICDAVLPTDLLGAWVRERKGLSLEKAVRKLTGEPAELFGLDRGALKVGAPADITVFDPDTVAPGPIRRVHDFPAGGERLIADKPEGMRHMLVNGEPIRRDGESLARPAAGGPGRVLRGG